MHKTVSGVVSTISRKALANCTLAYRYESKTVLVVYGGPNEFHELAFANTGSAKLVEGSGVQITRKTGNVTLSFETSSERRVVYLKNSDLWVYILGKSQAIIEPYITLMSTRPQLCL